MPAGASRVVTLGEGLLRLSTLGRGRLDEARDLSLHVAGAELNVAVALSNLGLATTWISAVPDSPLGRRIVREVAGAGVDTTAVQRVAGGRLGLFFVEVGVGARPTSVWYDRAGSSFCSMAVPDFDVLGGARFAVVSGVTYALGARPRELAERFVATARGHRVPVCFDVNFRDRLWSAAQACEVLSPVLAAATVVVCGERDARRVFGCGGDHQEVVRGLAALCASDVELVVLTRGEDGAVAMTGDGRVIEQPAVPTEVVDRFGAGDAFTAGLVWGLLQDDPGLALRAANTLAALKCTVPGDFAQFTVAELTLAMSEERTVLLR